MEKYPHSTTVIRFQDCDPMGHLNNGRYIDYFINAREDHLLKYYNLNVYEYIKEKGRAWVVAKNEILYRRPALLMEEVIIESQVLEFSNRHIHVEMRMFDAKRTHIKSILRSHFVPFDMTTNRAGEHDEEIMKMLQSVHSPIDIESIEERARSIQEKIIIGTRFRDSPG